MSEQRNELVLRRRLRILGDILADPDHPFRAQLIALTDLFDATEANGDGPARTAAANGAGVPLQIHLPGSPPPRKGRLR